MSISSEKSKVDLDARVHAAETFYSMGLLTEAIDAYNEILNDVSDLDQPRKKSLKNKIDAITRELEELDQKEVTELSSKDLNLIRETLTSSQNNISQILNSGSALKELGLFNEAIQEFEKLFALDYPKIKIVLELLDNYIKIYPPAEAIQKIQEVMIKNGIRGREKVQVNNMLAFEMEKRGHKDLMQDLFKFAEKSGEQDGQLLQKPRSGAAAAVEQPPDKKFTHLLAEKISKKKPKSAPSGSKYDYLIDKELVDIDQLQKALAASKKMNKSVEYVLIEQFKVDKAEVGKSLEAYSGAPFISFDPNAEVPYELISNLKRSFLMNDVWIPMSWDKNGVEILVDDPRDLIKTDRISALVKAKNFHFSVGIKEDIEAYIKHFFDNKRREDAVSSVSAEDAYDMMPDVSFEEEEEIPEEKDIVDESSSKVVRLVDQVLVTAYRENVSDIHVEPSPVTKKTMIRFRLDGVCQEYISVPNTMAAAILSRIKIMANLDISERRLPQDGKIKFRRKGIPEFELRVATLPTAGGFEDAVMRILAKAGAMPIEDMGLTQRNLDVLLDIISQPYGLILVVGPTGSGKTTTLHAALGYINKPGIKIWTAEDPVEITQAGLRQVEVKPKIGLDFARVMRAFLRADPDVIMIGEMRDFETASTGVEASLTGHLVLSTLHTNSAPETITRLLDMGLNPLNFSDAFRGVLAQRLVRRLCKECREEYQVSEEEFDEIVDDFGRRSFKAGKFEYAPGMSMYRTKGCDVCSGTGYKGRMGIHEMMGGSPVIKKMIKKQAPADELFEQAAREGMYTLKQDGILKVFQGYTDMNEIRRVCID